jgi:hypothetical protein
MKWWAEMQLEWQDIQDWPFVQNDNGVGDWGCLVEGGKDGMFVVVVSLSWWILAQDPSENSRLHGAIADVTWVLNHLIIALSTEATLDHQESTFSVTPSTSRRKFPESIRIGPPSKCRRTAKN